ncbi:hypothetical protein PPL_07378 [Heterostelium album PN500]|uniref:Biotin transporter BioY n=1 Tax=Heterostelium pallidum (strain ATCC 26659 / Pp 5 / PN500) TaxID=670386 RepID=D3BFS7_HETP5|nr:hypothetical protein PPL_07378 [Heterostelium album PN500]EFA79687.1 hypothetical protein PPL_07378 [Heterostelium album PN500]|eukprot:XP_020431808.1 hypothetical protein PPL_07378 [Heterostelium album PN500]
MDVIVGSFDDNYIYAETLSGRRLQVHQDPGMESVGHVKSRIRSVYEMDGEVGDDFSLYHNGVELEDKDVINESLIASDNIQIRRNTYSCLVEHLISRLPTWKKWVVRVACVFVASLFIAALSQVYFFLPHAKTVPVTLQTLAVFLVGSLLGWKMGPIAVIVYLLEGLVGAPFFSAHASGYKILYGTTSGYLYGFVAAAFIVGFLAERGTDRVYAFHWRSTFFAMIIGDIVIYIVGIPVLAKYIGWSKAFTLGLVPFLVGDLVKIVIATALIPTIWKLLAFIFNRDFTISGDIKER